ncbi:MAG: choice-of-anchor J domain-containing protein [Bacteroidia bacterium]|nr:choice-of-anchor J domain-containing protein [Bacteroidia bacterium]
MLKKILYALLVSFSIHNTYSQVLYSERFNTLSLTTGTYTANSATQTYFYNDVPNSMFAINSGSLTADTLTGNYPFRANGQKQKAWLSYVPVNGTDTFAVSTSWLKPTGAASNWLITPTINNIAANTVLTWEALAPDLNNQDGYEVYVATNTSTVPVVGDFTSLIYTIAAEKSTWQTHGISLAAFVGQNIRIGFKNNSTNKYQLWIDDISVANITNAFDVSTISQNVYKYSSVNALNAIVATFKNNGYTPITNLTIDYKMDNGVAITETKIFSPALSYLESKQLTFTIPYSSATPFYNTFKIYPRLINGQLDEVAVNDTITGSITISDSVPTKKVLVEQFTSTNCGWCPDGYTSLKSIVSTNSNVIAASIHDNDNMSNASSNTLISDYTPTFPGATIDQYYFPINNTVAIEKNNWSSFITQRLAMKVPATVAITNFTYNPGTQQIDATVSSTFFGDVKGDYRLNLYVKENNVYGPIADSLNDNQWNQHNNLYTIPSSPYYQQGNLIGSDYIMSSAAFKHQYVINQMADGPYGAAGIIPVNGSTKGQTYSKNYSYVLPTTTGEFRYNADNIYLIGVLSEYNTNTKSRAILNVAEVKLNSKAETIVGIKDLSKTNIQLNVYPNPTSDICYLSYSLQNDEFVTVNVYNTLGELVYIETKNVNAGNVTHVLNLNELRSGNYSVQVSFKNNTITKKLTIIK